MRCSSAVSPLQFVEAAEEARGRKTIGHVRASLPQHRTICSRWLCATESVRVRSS